MARHWHQVSWFRLFVVIGLSVCSSLALNFGDKIISPDEVFNTFLQGLIVGFAFLQCPEFAPKPRTGVKTK